MLFGAGRQRARLCYCCCCLRAARAKRVAWVLLLMLHSLFCDNRHTVSLLIDYMIFSPKYRNEVLVGEVAMVDEAIIWKTCSELDIEVIDMAVNPDHVHMFI